MNLVKLWRGQVNRSKVEGVGKGYADWLEKELLWDLVAIWGSLSLCSWVYKHVPELRCRLEHIPRTTWWRLMSRQAPITRRSGFPEHNEPPQKTMVQLKKQAAVQPWRKISWLNCSGTPETPDRNKGITKQHPEIHPLPCPIMLYESRKCPGFGIQMLILP